jgi:demethylmenaquinone methyltransferase/2-methoxy-6-polyprenyl-1,4-benzoquinol methylase
MGLSMIDLDGHARPPAEISTQRARTPTPPAVRQLAYTKDARLYDQRTRAFQRFRRAIVAGLAPNPGDVVLDVGCGTGLCFPMLLDKIGPRGRIVGIDASPAMVDLARERVAREGWRNVEVMEWSIVDAPIAVRADAALFCAVHDILQSPEALRKVVDSLRPGAAVAAGGGKWASSWMVALNLHLLALHAPYIDSFDGFERPWNYLASMVDDFSVREMAFGTGFVATGRAPAPGGVRPLDARVGATAT